jgi:hypothetical protein
MTRYVEEFTVCDVCGTEGAGTHFLAIDGGAYVVDLCAQHEVAMAGALSPYASAARSKP